MKRIKWLMLLCAFAVMFAVPAWAENISFDVLQASIDAYVSTDNKPLTLESGVTYVATETRKSIIISKDITIDGNGATVSGDMTSNDFFISGDNAGITVEIKNLKIRDGKAAFTKQTTQGENMSLGGGGMLVFNTNLTLENVIFTNNVANDNNRPTSYGGGLNVWLDSKDATFVINITSCDFISNDASQQFGGAMQIRATNYTTASVDIVSCDFKENKAKFAGGAAIMTNFIDLVEKTNPAKHLKVSVRDCNFEENTASRSSGGLWLYAVRGPMSADVVNCTFTKNTSNTTNDTNNEGGGAIEIRTYHGVSTDARNDADVNIVNCVFDGNKAIRGGGIRSVLMESGTDVINSANLNVNVKNSTFINNIASVDYGGGIDTSLYKNKNKVGSDDSKINQLVQNCTFIGNEAKISGGAMSVGGYDKGSISNTVANSTFVNNSADVAAEIFVETTTDGDTTSNDNTVINALIWNDTPNSKDVVVVSGDNSKSKLTVTTSAFQSGALSTDVVSDDASEKDLTFSVNSEDKPINGINHTIVKPTLELNIGTPHASNDKVPEYDILGVKRNATTPTIGAAEYVDDSGYTIVASGDMVVDGTILSADISTSFDVTFTVSGDVSGYTVTWSGDIGVAGLTFSADGKLTGKPTVSADTNFKPVATITTAGGYPLATVSKDFTIKITSPDATQEEGTDSGNEAITLSASSTDVTVNQGGLVDITVTATTSSDNIAWTTSGDLPLGVTATKSGDKVYTITGKVADSADVKAYTYKVIASNDTNVASVDIKITVKAKEAEKETETTEYKLSVTVSPDNLSLNRGATSGNTLTATMTISPDTTFTPSYQWYSNTTASTSGGTAISSATSATYTVPTSTTGTFYYFVIAATTLSDASITAASNIVTVTITGGGDTTPDYANMSADEVAELAVKADGTISQDIVDALLETLTSSDGSYALTDVAASEQLVAIYAASAKAKSGVVNLSTLPLNSLSGIGTLLNNIATANDTTTSEMTLDLAGQDAKLTKVDGLSGVSLKALTLKNNTHVETVDLSGATIPTVTLEGSAVEELTLGKTANVQKVEASGLSTLTSIDIEGNPYIEDLNINQTSISTLNAAGCTSLDNVAASGGSTPGGGSLEELDITSCDNLTQLDVENNKLLGVKKPSPRFAKPGFRFNAGGQRRPAPSGFALARSMNFWSILRSLLGLGTSGTIPFTVTTTTVTFTNGGTLDDSTGVVTYTSTPTVFSYYYNPGFTTADTSAFTTAADGSSMDVTIGSASSSTDSGEVTLGSSGGGCDAGFGLGALSAVMLMFALKKKRS